MLLIVCIFKHEMHAEYIKDKTTEHKLYFIISTSGAEKAKKKALLIDVKLQMCVAQHSAPTR